ncbi:MAG: tetratricopeptide repeat protein, partial [Sediminispirochaetaceae bacterium]
PDHYWNYVDRGKLRLFVGNHEGALEDFNRAVEINPDYFLAYVYRAGLHDEKDRLEKALEDYKRVYEDKPDYYPLYQPAAVIAYIKEDYKTAREMFLRMYERFPDEYAAGLMVGICDYFAGNKDRADSFLDREMGNWPRDGHFYHLARLFTSRSEYDSVVLDKIDEEKKPPRRARALFYLGTYYKLQGKESLANTYFMEVSDAAIYGLFENRIVDHELEGVIDE